MRAQTPLSLAGPLGPQERAQKMLSTLTVQPEPQGDGVPKGKAALEQARGTCDESMLTSSVCPGTKQFSQ